MTTIAFKAPAHWAETTKPQSVNINTWRKLLAFADSQSQNRTLWFVLSLVVQGVLFLPVPAVVIYYFNAPVIVLPVTLTLFFANIIAGMTSAGIRTLITIFAASVIIHLAMLTIFIL